MQETFPEMVSASAVLSVMRIHMGLYACGRNTSGALDSVDCARLASEEIRNTDVMCFWYDWNLQQKKSRNAYVLTHLTEAIEKRRIEVQFLPAVRFVSGETSELEIISVWNDPKWGLMQEEVYLPALEEAGRATELNRYLLDESIAIMAQRKLAGQACVPLVRKLSSKEFLDQKFRRHGLQLIDSSGLPRSILSFGISESAFSTENRALNREVRTMRQQGFRVWLDDFGAGSMAMNGLLEPEFDAMRINLSTLKHHQETGRYQEILTGMLSLGRTIHLTSVVSGTSGSEEETMLMLEGCQKLQKTAAEAAFPADQLEERLKAGFLPPLEEMSLRTYYDTIGSIRLRISPSKMAPAPSAVFEEKEGHCRCLRWNHEFLDLLEEFDIHGISQLNEKLETEPYRSLAEKQIEGARTDQRWHAVRFADQVSMNGACRFAACNDSDHRTAVLTVFFGSLQNSIGIPEP